MAEGFRPAKLIDLNKHLREYPYGLEIICNCGLKDCQIVVNTEWYDTKEERQKDIDFYKFEIQNNENIQTNKRG